MKYKVICTLLIILLYSCNSNENVNKPLSIKFSKDSSKIILSHLGAEQLYQLKQNLNTDTSYQALVSITSMPLETDTFGKEVIISGQLSMQGDSLIYTPEKPFVSGHSYLIETMVNAAFATRAKTIRGDVGHYVKAETITLTR